MRQIKVNTMLLKPGVKSKRRRTSIGDNLITTKIIAVGNKNGSTRENMDINEQQRIHHQHVLSTQPAIALIEVHTRET